MSDSFQKIAHDGLVMGLEILEQKQELLKELTRLREERDRLKEELAEKRLVWAINERYRKALENLVDAISKQKERSMYVRIAYSEAKQALSSVDGANGNIGSEGER